MFKNSKTKINQQQLRKLMQNHKQLGNQVKKIQSPLAKYNENGEIICVLCQTIVKSENVWIVHVNAKQHKENVTKAKQFKEKTNNFTQVPSQKRPAVEEDQHSHKKLKGILKNSNQNNSTKINERIDSTIAKLNETTISSNSKIVEKNEKQNEVSKRNSLLPEGFFDSSKVKSKDGKQVEEKIEIDTTLPEGFFDDPKEDAKARHVEYKNPIDEEWEMFQKQIKNITTDSEAIVDEEQEIIATERQIDEIDEQIQNWSRVLALETKKEEVLKKKSDEKESKMDDDNSDSFDENDIDDFELDWRSKNAFKK